jgi:hypothetical protein
VTRAKNLSSHTELSELTSCERRWWYKYVKGIRGEASDPMILGSTMGVLCDAFWRHEDWRQELAGIVAEAGGGIPDLIDLDQVTEEPYATAYWLMQRYERHYANMLDSVEVVYTELDCRAKIPGTNQVHQAIIDNIFAMKTGMKIGKKKLHFMVERKTYGRMEKLDFVDVDPQLTNNLWVAQEVLGIKIDGIIFDGIYTYRWKAEKPTQKTLIEEAICAADTTQPDAFDTWAKKRQLEWARAEVERHPGVERPDSESFEMLFLDRTPAHIEAAQEELKGQLRRRAQLRRGVRPNRNIGPFCKNCPAKSECFSDLAFPQNDIEVVA